MKSTNPLFLVFLCFSAAAAMQAQALTPIPITTCGTVITQPGQYVLANDLLNCSGNGVEMSGVTGLVELNLASHQITGTGGGDGIFARLFRAPGNLLTIRGPGTISGFGAGVHAENDGFVNVFYVTCTRNNIGFSVRDDTIATVSDNSATENRTEGFRLLNSSSDIIRNSAINNGTDGFVIRGQDNVVERNTALNNGRYGIYGGGSGNDITFSIARNNTSYDLVQPGLTCVNNWDDNTFKTANLPCIGQPGRGR